MVTVEELLEHDRDAQSNTSNQEGTTVYTWNNKQYPIPKRCNISEICKTILALNERANLVTVLLNGKSSSGKSTLTQTIAHRVSCMNPTGKRYVIKWFKGKDILRIDEIIRDLPKGLDYILIMDDQSFILDQAPPRVRKMVQEKFTTIRHDFGENSKIILFMNIHYLRATSPITRDAWVRILTSTSSEDARNAKESFGWNNQFMIDKFQKQFASQISNGYFYVNMEGKSYKYKTDEPFRIALCSDPTGTHFLTYPKEGCQHCSPAEKKVKEKIDAKVLVDEFKQTYTSKALPALQYFSYFVKGHKEALPLDKLRAVQFLQKMFERYDVDMKDLVNIVSTEKRKRGTHHFQFKEDHEELEKNIIQEDMYKSL